MPDSRALAKFRGLLFIVPSFIPILPLHLSSTVLVVWAIAALFCFITIPDKRISFPKLLLLPICMFFLFLIYWPFADDKLNQASYIERNLAWFVIPIAYWLLGMNQRKQWNNSVLYFIGAFSLMIIFAHFKTVIQLHTLKDTAADELTFFYRTTFENISGLHPAYATLFSGLCIIYCFYHLISENNFSILKRSLILLVALIHFSSTIVLASRMALIATVVGMIILIFSKKIYFKRGLITLSAFVVVGLFFSLSTPFISSRVHEVSSDALKLPVQQTGNTLSIRNGIYTCGFTLLKEHWLLGVSPGDLQLHLNHCYGSINAVDLKAEEYNTHDEYLNKWLSFGVAGILLLLALLIVPMIKAFKTEFFVYACFSVLMMLVLISENIFSRQYGLLFFLIFYTPGLLILSNKRRRLLK